MQSHCTFDLTSSAAPHTRRRQQQLLLASAVFVCVVVVVFVVWYFVAGALSQTAVVATDVVAWLPMPVATGSPISFECIRSQVNERVQQEKEEEK